MNITLKEIGKKVLMGIVAIPVFIFSVLWFIVNILMLIFSLMFEYAEVLTILVVLAAIIAYIIIVQ